MAADTHVDVVMYPSGEVKAVPAGKGGDVVRSYRERSDGPSAVRRVVTWLLVAFILAYSLLIARNVVLGIAVVTLVYAATRLLPRFTGTDADLLDADVALRDAREQWDAEPVSAVKPSADRERRPSRQGGEREHAFE